VRGQLAPYEYPKAIEFIDQLPMTTTGKIQRRVLRLQEQGARRRASRASRPRPQPGQFVLVETGRAPGFEIERAAQLRRGTARPAAHMWPSGSSPRWAHSQRYQWLPMATCPTSSRRMMSMIAAAAASPASASLARTGGEASSPRFQRARHQRHARQHVARGAIGHLPELLCAGKSP
jgi:hypothetical protein